MVMPKPKLSYEGAYMSMPKGFNFLCSGCRETFTIYPKGEPFTYTCWCGSKKNFTGKEANDGV